MVKPKYLFVCEANAQRSPTFENWFKAHRFNEYEVRSAGTHWGYPYQVKEAQLTDTLVWADRVFVMDLKQYRFIKQRFPSFIDKVTVIGVSDEYNRNSVELFNIIDFWVDNFLEA
jgi:predicted protein tyrosine phosphatase